MEDSKLSVKPDALLLLSRLRRFLVDEGIQAYLVGGFVRDILLGRDTADIDIAMADGPGTARKVAAVFGGKYVLLDELNGVGRVVLEGDWVLDFSTIKGSIEQDLARRDFTIDAMAIELTAAPRENQLDLRLSMLIDPFGSRNDLERKTVRAVSETAFKADAARSLRAVRLAAELDFIIDEGTQDLIRRDSSLIAGVAGERAREELLRILARPGAGQRLSQLNELGLLTVLIPELAEARGVSQPTVHFWDVFEHSMRTVAAADFLLRQGSWQYATEEVLASVPWSTILGQHFDEEVSSGSTREALLRLTALLHDIAKPRTKTIDEDGRARFLGHGKEGAAIAAGILERLRFSAREIRLVALMIEHHLRPGQMGQDGLPSHRAIYRYFRDTGEAGVDILFLSLADHLATRGPDLDIAEWQRHAQLTDYVLAQYFAEKSAVAPPKIIDGRDLINIFGLSPGPRIGELLEMVREAQAAGEVTTREEALAYIRNQIGESAAQ